MNIAQTRARAARWAEHDARAPFRQRPGKSLTVAGTVIDFTGQKATNSGALRGRRCRWPTRKAREPKPRTMIEVEQGCFVSSTTAMKLKLRSIEEGRQYSFVEAQSDSALDWEDALPIRQPSDPVLPPHYWLGGRECRFPASYTGMPTWQLPKHSIIAANDNAPLRPVVRQENDAPTPEWLAERNAAGHAIYHSQMGTRIERALLGGVRKSEDAASAVMALRQVRELLRPAELKAANDNALIDDGETEETRSHGLERIHNQSAFIPSIPKLLAAYADGMRCRVTKRPDGTVTRVSPQAWTDKDGRSTVWIGGTDGRRFVGLLFIKGRLEFFGDKGRKRAVDYKTPVSGAKPEVEDVIAHRLDELCGTASYLQLGGTIMPPAAHNDNVPLVDVAIPEKKAATRAWLWKQMEGKPVTQCPVGIAAVWNKRLGLECGYARLAGVSEAIGVGEGKTEAPAHAALTEIDRSISAPEFIGKLSGRERDILRAILDGESFLDVARAAEMTPTSHNGKRVTLGTLQRINELLAA